MANLYHRPFGSSGLPWDVVEPPATELATGYTAALGQAMVAIEYVGIAPAGITVTVVPSSNELVRTITLKPDRIVPCEIDRITWAAAAQDHQIRIYLAKDDEDPTTQ